MNYSPKSRMDITALFSQSGGLITPLEAQRAGFGPHVLSYWAKKGVLERVQPGVYKLVDHPGFDQDILTSVMLRVPSAVLCLGSAIAYHGLSKIIPTEIHIAVPRNSTVPKIQTPPVSVHRFSEKQYRFGIEQHQFGEYCVQIYSKEKTLADFLRMRHSLGLSIFLESLKTYLAQSHFDTWKLQEAARVCRVEKLMSEYIGVILA